MFFRNALKSSAIKMSKQFNSAKPLGILTIPWLTWGATCYGIQQSDNKRENKKEDAPSNKILFKP